MTQQNFDYNPLIANFEQSSHLWEDSEQCSPQSCKNQDFEVINTPTFDCEIEQVRDEETFFTGIDKQSMILSHVKEPKTGQIQTFNTVTDI